MAIPPKQIKEWNKHFKSLTASGKRVAIAKDILAQIKAKIYKPKKGMYVDFNRTKMYISQYIDSPLNMYGKDIQANFDVISNCKVCALGSAALSCIKYTNEVKFEEANSDDEKLYVNLLKVFSKKQLCIIEYAFEGWRKPCSKGDFANGKARQWGMTITEKEVAATYKFFKKYTKTEDRLIAIWKNVIKNEGLFKP